MFTTEFLITSLIIVMLPGTGVIYTISTGLFVGRRASTAAAVGCTFGSIPHLLVSILGLSAILHLSAQAFVVLKYLGAAYLLYVAWTMWRDTGRLNIEEKRCQRGMRAIAVKGFLINILTPKLSMFFIAFLPQFVPVGSVSPVLHLILLSGIFMLITLGVFLLYGLFAGTVRDYVINSPRILNHLQRSFAVAFAALGARLAMAER
ncbi:LysE family translocator [Sedimenticola selenatireducens]|uniref:Lysine transporter LysE n=1 Tax=Sedimenticola selenatireducens TaxID=191960 RepID=A0A2N6CVC6_9GAMM|nr:LysE family translocator [Sedimenticola selenatireducens]PLX61145.1 MAG: lysine transporter LysE [Sedimenticola selenatireducens]